jgi:uncharacterized protein YoxC
MVIFITINRQDVETYWMPKVYGESARPLLNASLAMEKEIWRIAGTTMKPQHLEELRVTILAWRKTHPDISSYSNIGAMGLSTIVARLNRGPSVGFTTNVFNLLSVDPLADLDPAVKQIASTRLTVERSLFLVRQMPTLLSLETQLLTLTTVDVPQIDQLLKNTTNLSTSIDRISISVEKLPDQISTETKQIDTTLTRQLPGMTSLTAQAEKTLTAGATMANSTKEGMVEFHGILDKIQSVPNDPRAKPFDINEYTAAASKINETVKTMNATLSPENIHQLTALTDRATVNGQGLVDYTISQVRLLALLLIGGLCVMVVISIGAFFALKKRFA